MLNRTFLAAIAAVGLVVATSSIADAKHRFHHRQYGNGVNIGIGIGGFGNNGFNDRYYSNGFNDRYHYYDDYAYDDEDCSWQLKKTKRWNSSHTRFTIRKQKVWTCY
jgi:hypothetical protein